jgi:hypothetical protein
MATANNNGSAGWGLAVDGWAVLVAFLLALAVRLGIISKVPW